MAATIRWSDEEYDIVARAVLALPEGKRSRAEMLREGQKALPKNRQKVIIDHLGGKPFEAFKVAMERVQTGVKVEQRRDAAVKARSKMSELRKSLAGQGERMAEAMKKAGKSDSDVANATGVTLPSIRLVLKHRTKTMMDKNIARIATYLGCNYGWLRAGVDAEMPLVLAIGAAPDSPPPAPLIPKGNGKHPKSHEGRIEDAMQSNIDTTVTALWSLLPMDAKVMVIARMAELVAMGARKQ